MWQRRIERVNELLLREISNFVLENQPPDMGFVTFTGVSVTEDLEQARVYFSVMGTDAEKARSLDLLNAMRTDLTRRMRRLESLKRIPELHFEFDATPERAARVHEIIEHLHAPPPAAAAPATKPGKERPPRKKT